MSTEAEKPKKVMPKGGRKGGAIFPRTPLPEAVGYAKKLVSKTHSAPQPIDIIYSGVVGAKGGTGDVKISALKQYGFIHKDPKQGFLATELAKKLSAAPDDERLPFLKQAALRPTVFKKIFDTYHGDQVSKAKLKQRAADLNVHPDETETCIDIYIKSLVMADLVSVEGDQVTHRSAVSDLSSLDAAESGDIDGANGVEAEAYELGDDVASTQADASESTGQRPVAPVAKAVFNVNVTLDSSLDIEKLAKQLELLKRFGAI